MHKASLEDCTKFLSARKCLGLLCARRQRWKTQPTACSAYSTSTCHFCTASETLHFRGYKKPLPTSTTISRSWPGSPETLRPNRTLPITSCTTAVRMGAWAQGKIPGAQNAIMYIFACSPREFKHSGSFTSCFPHPSIFNSEFSITNKGLKMASTLRKGARYGSYMMPLMCCASTTARDYPKRLGIKGKSLGICLEWVGGTTYVRANCTELKYMNPRDLEQCQDPDDVYLAPSVEQLHHSINDLYMDSIILPHSNDLSIPGTKVSIWSTKVSPGFMWDDKERVFLTYGHQDPVGCASYELPGRSDILFTAFFGLYYNGVPWLSLAGPDSPLLLSHVDSHPNFLKRAALVAKQSCTTRLVIDIGDHPEDANQKWLIVEGSLGITGSSSQSVHAHRVNFSFGLESGQTPTVRRRFLNLTELSSTICRSLQLHLLKDLRHRQY